MSNNNFNIDSCLGDSKRGEVESKKLFLMGFENLYIVTGYQKNEFIQPFWIKDIFGKSPECIIPVFSGQVI
jgi:hypothetical protein